MRAVATVFSRAADAVAADNAVATVGGTVTTGLVSAARAVAAAATAVLAAAAACLSAVTAPITTLWTGRAATIGTDFLHPRPIAAFRV